MSDTLLLDAQQASQEGRLDDAARLYLAFLNANPTHPPALYALALIYFQGSQFAQAEYLLGEAIKADPAFVDALCVRGVTMVKQSRPEEALACFEQALALKPDFLEALSNHATTLLELGRLQEGLHQIERVLSVSPDHVLTLNNHGNALFGLKRYEEAVASYDRALAIYPDFPDARANRLLALGEMNRGDPRFAEILFEQGENLMRHQQFIEALGRFDEAFKVRPDYPEARALYAIAYREAHRRLFDESASLFEASLVGDLNYRGHLQLREMAERVWPGGRFGLRVLDLGCGTGLVGDQFQSWASGGGRLDGIDFSARMLDEAKKRGIYHKLYLGDIEQMLGSAGEIYDLMLAADTLIYFNDLDAILRGAAEHLLPGGFFLFTVESKENSGWEPTPKRRFRHSKSYVRECAERAGLIFVDRVENILRFDTGAPVPGLTMAFRK